ncbi:hypothetical protein [Leifsonia aquatica]|uniref:hypothetical protein n=1 Tax=Leifsonia aquatica TaxID=144185 RepID=UPI000469690F|nr:hypothetical protein [Leifsonia aquatica]
MVNDTDTDTEPETPLDELWADIEDLRNMIGDNEHPDDYVSEREDLAELEKEWERRTTPSQRAAMEGEGGMFVPRIEDGHVLFRDEDGNEIAIEISAGWSSLTPGLPIVQIDTTTDLGPNEPEVRIFLNDSTIHQPKENA